MAPLAAVLLVCPVQFEGNGLSPPEPLPHPRASEVLRPSDSLAWVGKANQTNQINQTSQTNAPNHKPVNKPIK